MAIFHFTAKIVRRKGGQSAVAKSAYISRERLTDERTGEVKDYRRAEGLVFSGIFTPTNAPDWAHDREKLWNEVERVEKQKNSTLAREYEIALPHELTDEQRRFLVQDFVRENFTRKGYAADVNIHAPDREGDERNDHAHILVTDRRLEADGFARDKKERQGTEKERVAELEGLREKWERTTNRHLERHGHEERIDRRTLEAQGRDREPTQHLGPAASALEREGQETERGDINREIEARNQERERAEQERARENERDQAAKHWEQELEREAAQERENERFLAAFVRGQELEREREAVGKERTAHEGKDAPEREAMPPRLPTLEERLEAIHQRNAEAREKPAPEREPERNPDPAPTITREAETPDRYEAIHTVADVAERALDGFIDFFAGTPTPPRLSLEERLEAIHQRNAERVAEDRAERKREADEEERPLAGRVSDVLDSAVVNTLGGLVDFFVGGPTEKPRLSLEERLEAIHQREAKAREQTETKPRLSLEERLEAIHKRNAEAREAERNLSDEERRKLEREREHERERERGRER